MDTVLNRAISKLGSKAALARALGIKPQAIQQWEFIPEAWALDVENATTGEVTAVDVLTEAKACRGSKAA